MWQRHQWRPGVTWSAPGALRFATSYSLQSGTPSGPIVTNIAEADPQFGAATPSINGRNVSNLLATTVRFVYPTRGAGQLWTPWMSTWNARVGRVFKTSERSSVEVDLDVFNIPNAGAAEQFLGSGNQVNSANYGGLQNIQVPRWAQFSVRWRF